MFMCGWWLTTSCLLVTIDSFLALKIETTVIYPSERIFLQVDLLHR